MFALPVSHLKTLALKHSGDCSLIGVTADGVIYAEEVYGPEGWVAQNAFQFDGTWIESVDELDGTAADLKPLTLPPDILKPKTGWQTMALNFAGPRHRGLRGQDRVGDVVRSLGLDEKMQLIATLKLDIIPPLLLGIAESYVLAEAEIVRPTLYFVCRRVRLAVALPEERIDADGQPYDYETLVLYLAHFFDCAEESSLVEVVGDLTDVTLRRPMDCLLCGDRLYIADGGEGERRSAIHVWQVELPEPQTREQQLSRKIYG